MSETAPKKLCPWSVAALALCLLPLILVFTLTDSAEPLPDGVQYALLLAGVLVSAALPPVAKHIRIRKDQKGKFLDLAALILSLPVNALVCALFISFFTAEGSGSAFGEQWYLGLLPSAASLVAYLWPQKQK